MDITEGSNLERSELNVANELLDLTDHLMLEAPAFLNEEGLQGCNSSAMPCSCLNQA